MASNILERTSADSFIDTNFEGPQIPEPVIYQQELDMIGDRNAQRAFLSQPVSVQALRQLRGDALYHPIENYTAVCSDPENAEFLPFGTFKSGEKKIGRLLDVDIAIESTDKKESYTVWDLDWAPGDIGIKAEIYKATHQPDGIPVFTPLRGTGNGISGAHSLYVEDPNSEHPLAFDSHYINSKDVNPYDDRHDSRLAETLFSSDVNAHDALLYDARPGMVTRRNDDGTERTEAGFIVNCNMLSRMDNQRQDGVVNMFWDEDKKGNRTFNHDRFRGSIDLAIGVFGTLHELLVAHVDDYNDPKTEKRQDVKLEELWKFARAQLSSQRQLTQGGKRFSRPKEDFKDHANQLLDYFERAAGTDIGAWGRMCSAAYKAKVISNFEIEAGLDNLSPASRTAANEARDNIRHEFFETISMTQINQLSNIIGRNLVRAEFTLRDTFDVRWAQVIQIIKAGHFAQTAKDYNKAFGGPNSKPGMLSVQPAPNNQVEMIDPGSGKGGVIPPSAAYICNEQYMYDGSSGARPRDIKLSFYEDGKPLMIPGLKLFEIASPDMCDSYGNPTSIKMIDVNHRHAPGRLLQTAINAGAVSGAVTGLKAQPTFESALNSRQHERQYAITRNTATGHEVVRVLQKNRAVVFTHNTSGTGVTLHDVPVTTLFSLKQFEAKVAQEEIVELNKKRRRGDKLQVSAVPTKPSSYESGRYVVWKPNGLRSHMDVLVGVAVMSNVLHVHGPDIEPEDVQTRIMPNLGKPDAEEDKIDLIKLDKS